MERPTFAKATVDATRPTFALTVAEAMVTTVASADAGNLRAALVKIDVVLRLSASAEAIAKAGFVVPPRNYGLLFLFQSTKVNNAYNSNQPTSELHSPALAAGFARQRMLVISERFYFMGNIWNTINHSEALMQSAQKEIA